MNGRRTLVASSSSGWTEDGGRDPGVAVVEVFGWLIEPSVYRVNGLPVDRSPQG